MMVVSDSTCLIVLAKIDRLDILKTLFGKIYIPESVYKETVTDCPKEYFKDKDVLLMTVDEFIEVVQPKTNYPFRRKLGRGERASLNLTFDLKANALITDDKRAIILAEEFNFQIFKTSNVLVQAEKKKLIPSYTEVMEELRRMNIFLSE